MRVLFYTALTDGPGRTLPRSFTRPLMDVDIPGPHAVTCRAASSGWLLILMACLLAGLLTSPGVSAVTVPNLYEVQVPGGGGADAARNTAFAAALRAVAVKVSGVRDAGERLPPATVADGRRYVQRFGANPDGTLRVGFDGASINRILAENDLPVWGSERPLTLVWLAIEDATGQASWVGQDPALPEARIVEQVAQLRGLPLAWPAMDMEDRQLAAALDSEGSQSTRLTAIGSKYRADAVLVGRARRNVAGDVTVRWLLRFGETMTETDGSLPEGVHAAADQLARLFSAAAGSTREVIVDVAAINDMRAYADTLTYLEGLTLVRSVSVENVSGDVVRFRLLVRGDADILRRAIGLGSRLTSEPGETGVEPLRLRYQPGAAGSALPRPSPGTAP